jgi:hypothetical protein
MIVHTVIRFISSYIDDNDLEFVSVNIALDVQGGSTPKVDDIINEVRGTKNAIVLAPD